MMLLEFLHLSLGICVLLLRLVLAFVGRSLIKCDRLLLRALLSINPSSLPSSCFVVDVRRTT
jgi:hypothetical protein